MQSQDNYRYSREHTWVSVMDNNFAVIGITEFAQSELGEIVFVDLPQVGKRFKKDEVFGSVEAVKTTSDLFIPVSGEIIEVNTSLISNASLVNSASLTDGWMIKLQLQDASEIDALLDAKSYQALVEY